MPPPPGPFTGSFFGSTSQPHGVPAPPGPFTGSFGSNPVSAAFGSGHIAPPDQVPTSSSTAASHGHDPGKKRSRVKASSNSDEHPRVQMNIKTLMKKKSWKSCASAKVIKEEVSAHHNIDMTESPEEQLQSKEDVLKKIRKNPRIMSRFKHCTKCVVAE